MKLVNEEDDVASLADFIHDGLDAFFKLTPVFCACHHEGEIKGDHTAVTQEFRNVAAGDFLGKAFNDSCFANPGLSNENRVVLGAATQDLNHALDFRCASDDRVELVFLGEFGEVAPKGLEGRVLTLALVLSLHFVLALIFIVLELIPELIRVEIRINLREDFLPGLVDVHIETGEHPGSDSLPFTQQSQENVLSAHIGVVKLFSLFVGEGENLLDPGSVGDVPGNGVVRAGANLLFHLNAHGFEIQTHVLHHTHSDALSQFD